MGEVEMGVEEVGWHSNTVRKELIDYWFGDLLNCSRCFVLL